MCFDAAGGDPELALLLAVQLVRRVADGDELPADQRVAAADNAARVLRLNDPPAAHLNGFRVQPGQLSEALRLLAEGLTREEISARLSDYSAGSASRAVNPAGRRGGGSGRACARRWTETRVIAS